MRVCDRADFVDVSRENCGCGMVGFLDGKHEMRCHTLEMDR